MAGQVHNENNFRVLMISVSQYISWKAIALGSDTAFKILIHLQ